jgi:hypothetical protein
LTSYSPMTSGIFTNVCLETSILHKRIGSPMFSPSPTVKKQKK